jgi:hypothetical protein
MLAEQNNNNAPAANNAQQIQVPTLPPLQLEAMQTIIKDMVQAELNNCLWYHIQCTDCDGAAKALKVQTNTIRDWVKAGKLGGSKVGNSIMIPIHAIYRMLQNNLVTTPVVDMRRRINKKAI